MKLLQLLILCVGIVGCRVQTAPDGTVTNSVDPAALELAKEAGYAGLQEYQRQHPVVRRDK